MHKCRWYRDGVVQVGLGVVTTGSFAGLDATAVVVFSRLSVALLGWIQPLQGFPLGLVLHQQLYGQ